MKIDSNDPRITAFALGELHGDEAVEIARAVRSDAKARAAVEQARETSFELLGALHGEADMLTTQQRETVRRAGNSPVITDIASARTPIWKQPAVVGIGVAAAVAIGVFVTIGEPNTSGAGSGNGIADAPTPTPAWDWGEVSLGDLTAPVTLDPPKAPSANAHSVSSAPSSLPQAIAQSPAEYREQVAKRIASSTHEEGVNMKGFASTDPAWSDVAGIGYSLTIPQTSGVASWPWLERYVLRENKLPPRHTVRIEELVNHFSYTPPTRLQEGGFSGDIEICRTPWNPSTCLVAVNLKSEGGFNPRLMVSDDRVKQIRLLGYTSTPAVKPTEETPMKRASAYQSITNHSNYVICELVLINPNDTGEGFLPIVDLFFSDSRLFCGKIKTWSEVSADFRFASTVAATGMLLLETPDLGNLTPSELSRLIAQLETSGLSNKEHKKALTTLKRVASLLAN
ncbi:MAG: VWA domain-containing protein [Akkermansiaceae bacterium]